MTKKPYNTLRARGILKRYPVLSKKHWEKAESFFKEKPPYTKVDLKLNKGPAISFDRQPSYSFIKLAGKGVYLVENFATNQKLKSRMEMRLFPWASKSKLKRKKHIDLLKGNRLSKSKDERNSSEQEKVNLKEKPELIKQFRQSFLKFRENTKHETRLIISAQKIYGFVVKQHGLVPDDNWGPMYEIVKDSLQGIRISEEFYNSLNLFWDELFNSGQGAAVVINMAISFLNPNRSELREITIGFLNFHDIINKQISVLVDRNRTNILFLRYFGPNPVIKKTDIEELFNSLFKEIFTYSRHTGERTFLNAKKVGEKRILIENHINTLGLITCKNILDNLKEKIQPILKSDINSKAIRHDFQKIHFRKQGPSLAHFFKEKNYKSLAKLENDQMEASELRLR